MERIALITQYRFSLGLLWLLMALSSLVFIEPTPYDLLLLALFMVFFGLGLRIPTGIAAAGYLLGIFIIANIVASALAPDPAASFRSLFVRIFMLASWVLLTSLIYENPKRVLRVLFAGYMVAAIIAVIAGILGYYKLVPWSAQLIEFGRVRSLFKDPNVYGPFLVPVALYIVARLETANNLEKLRLIGIFVLLTFGILLSFSRGSWLNFSIALVLFFILRISTHKSPALKRRLLLQGGALALFGALFMGWLISTEEIQHMIEIRTKVQYYDVQEGGRFSIQKRVIDTSLIKPLGIGAGQTEHPHYFGKAPHNIYLHVLVEAGWIGALAFYGFLGLTLWKATRFAFQPSDIQAIYIAILACLVGLLAQSLFVDSTHWRHMYLLFAALWGPPLAWQTDIRSGAEATTDWLAGDADPNPR